MIWSKSSDEETLDLPELLDDRAEVGPILRCLIPALLHQLLVLWRTLWGNLG